jgi:hypothetical protein
MVQRAALMVSVDKQARRYSHGKRAASASQGWGRFLISPPERFARSLVIQAVPIPAPNQTASICPQHGLSFPSWAVSFISK